MEPDGGDFGTSLGTAWSTRMHPSRPRTRWWALNLLDGLVDVVFLLFALSVATLVMAAITLILMQSLRLAGGNESAILAIGTIIIVLGAVLSLPMIIVFAHVLHLLVEWYGTRCPSCAKRTIQWQSGRWTYGEPPAFLDYACANCGARYRQLNGGQGVLSDLEEAGDQSEVSPSGRIDATA
jgi:hypothetical protein